LARNNVDLTAIAFTIPIQIQTASDTDVASFTGITITDPHVQNITSTTA
jgi:hypothetical protein